MNYLQKKKQALMSIVNSIKGFLRSVNGTPPITLENCVDDKSLINYQIFGNSVQDGEPSPDAPVEVVSVGEYDTEIEKYKIPVIARGKNLLNEELFLDESNWIFSASGDTSRFNFSQIGLEEGKRYTLLYNLIGDVFSGNAGISVYNSSGYVGGFKKDSVSGAFSFIATDSRLNLYVPGANGAKSNYHTISERYQIMIVEGSYTLNTIGEYEPYVEPITTNIYLDEPLRKLGNYADYIDFTEGKLYRHSAMKYITKDLRWTKNTSPTTTGMYGNYISIDMEKGTRLPGYCNVLPANKQGWNTWTYPQVHFGQANSAVYILTETQMATNEDIYNYLSNNGEVEPYIIYIKGNNDAIIEPTETAIDLSNLPTFKGTTTYTINTNIQPSNMAAEYYSTVKGD